MALPIPNRIKKVVSGMACCYSSVFEITDGRGNDITYDNPTDGYNNNSDYDPADNSFGR